jgi:hypothetical protein
MCETAIVEQAGIRDGGAGGYGEGSPPAVTVDVRWMRNDVQ